ncbi:MAG TPA: insulinase family protein [Kofleriaceae bacterium]|nr:insulinase family protein [Kofleriaceae bacterium]
MRRNALLLAAVTALGCGSHTPAPTPPPTTGGPVATPIPPAPIPPRDPLDKQIPTDARVKVGRLPNGLTYYILPHKKPLARANLWLAVNAGSILEDDDQRGLAHLVEHMAFNGTKNFPKQAVVDFMEKSGMRFGPDVNAYTSFDQTVYQLTVPTDDGKSVDTGLDILRDWAGNIAFEPEEVEKERGVVLEEWRLGRGAFMRLFDKEAPVLFHDSRYKDRLTIGLPEVIKGAPRDRVVQFYKDWYRPELMAVIVVGDVADEDAIVAGITKRFGDLADPAKPKPRIAYPIPHDHDLLVSVATDPEMPFTQVQIYDKMDHRAELTLRDYRRVLVEQLFHDMLNQRFEEIARRPDAPFTGAFSGSDDLGRTADAYVRAATARAGHAEEALAGIYQEVVRVERHGFGADEFDRAKKNLLRRYETTARERDKTNGRQYADEITRLYFTAEFMPGAEGELAMAQQFLPDITLDEINALAKQGGQRGRVVVVTGPAKDPLPDAAKVKDVIAQIEKSDVGPWTETAAPASLMAAAPKGGTITKTREIPEIGVTEWTLSNGAKVVVKPTDFQNDDVELSGFSPGGTSLVKDKDFDTARFADDVINDGGVGDYDRIALGKALTGKAVHASAWIGELEEGVSAGASPDDLETMFQLVYLRFTAPRKDADAFAAWKTRELDYAQNRRLQPERAFFEDMDSFKSQKHPRRAPVTPEVVNKVDLDKALAIYKDRFADAGDFTFVIVGNVDLEKLRPMVETYLASLPATKRKETWKDVGVHFPKGAKELDVTGGTEPKSFVYYARHATQKWTKDTDRDLKILQMLLSIRLREVLREDMSGVYGVQVWANVTRRPRQEREFGVFFGCDPANVEKLRDAVVNVVKTVQKDGLGDDYLEKVRAEITRGHETELRENRYWLYKLADAWRFGDDPKDIPSVDPILARVTSDNVKAAAKKYLDAKDSVLAVLRPVKAESK